MGVSKERLGNRRANPKENHSIYLYVLNDMVNYMNHLKCYKTWLI
jgi:hypothetical protein